MVSINYERKCIFFHIPKTAGSYIQKALNSKYDFIGYNYCIRYDTGEFNLKPSFFSNKTNHINNSSFLNSNPYSCKTLGIQKYFSSSSLMLKMMKLNEEKWDNLFKFTFVRNPYERFISGWNYVLHGFKTKKIVNDENLDLEEINKLNDLEYTITNKNILTPIAYNHIFMTQYEHILDRNNKNNMDFIGKIENLEKDLEFVLNKIGITEIIHDKEKKVNKTEHKYYKEYYSQTILDFVNDFFDVDFREFGYTKFNNMDDFLKEEKEELA